MAKVTVPLSHRPEPVEIDHDEIPGLIAQGLLKPEDVPKKAQDAVPTAAQAADSGKTAKGA